jgi:(2Fe-2S) ferredoxin
MNRAKIEKAFEKSGLRRARKHLFLCLGPDCCSPDEGEKTWKYIKERLKDVDLKVMRTKAQCFRICTDGPWLVVYPDGVWYSRVTPKRFERILQEHLIGGVPIEDWIVARNALSKTET